MSFCPKCGKEVEEGSGFCGNCGAKIGQQTARESELLKSGEKSFDLKLSEMSKKQKIRGIAIIVVIIAAIIGVSLFVNRKEKLNLDDYISVNYTGYDTVGTATATFDFEKFDRDVKLKMRYKNSTEQTALFNDIYEDINKSIAFDLSKESELKNGDKIELKWNCQKEIALNEYNIILNCKDKTLDVNQLKPTKKVDLFKDVTIQYEGIAPNIRVTIQNNSTDSVLSSLYLTADKTSGI